MEMNIATKLRIGGKKNVATLDNSVATKNRVNGKKNFVITNEDTLKQCHDIRIDCHNKELQKEEILSQHK